MKVNSTGWFSINMHPSCKYGTRHLFKTIQQSRYLSKELRDIVDPILQRNGYFGHPENPLFAMISDERQYIRELGLRRILKARLKRSNTLRTLNVPKLNLDANYYVELNDWKDKEITEPPLTADVSEEDIRMLAKAVDNRQLSLKDFRAILNQ